MHEKILIIDFGSQYTQLIARRVRESEVYCEIVPFNNVPEIGNDIKGIILSGGPSSVNDTDAPYLDTQKYATKAPLLGVCYGAQLLAKQNGGNVEKSDKREYGRAHLEIRELSDKLMHQISNYSQVWMSHGDTIRSIGNNFELVAESDSKVVAAFRAKENVFENEVYALQFHPEVYHSTEGQKILNNFLFDVCGCKHSWTPASFVEETIA
ncbi:MAG TPA: glutamine-hydrolyzing GMP synthase, partial [Chitinophagales bacterium]|nr:glutamine-hydrolyzing GMP synthase [Chitinophagales bacterium]